MDRANLFVIGVNKAGTSWLYYLLDSHPEIFMAKEKELYYFGHGYPDALEEYHAHFPFDEPYRYFGEATAKYYLEEAVVEQIYEYRSDARILAIIRDPIQRLISQFYYHKQLGYVAEDTPVAAVDGPVARNFRHQSHYERTLPRFAEKFGSGRFRVVSLEEANRAPDRFWEELQQDLGLAVAPLPNLASKPSNATGGKWFRMLYRNVVRPIKQNNPKLFNMLLRSPAVSSVKDHLLGLLGTAKKEALPNHVTEALRREFEPTYEYLAELGFDYYKQQELVS